MESAVAPTGDIGVRLSGRSSSSLFDECRATLGGRYRFPAGKNVPVYLADYCGRWYINSDSGNSYGTTAAFPSWMYPEDGNRFFPGTDPSAAMLRTPGVIASYWHDGNRFQLFGRNVMAAAERKWWKGHGQELVNSMAAPDGPDVIGLLHDKTSYGVYGDHGGAQEAVQRVPMVFWSPSLAFANTTAGPFTTPDILPTILEAMGIPLTAPLDGEAWNLG